MKAKRKGEVDLMEDNKIRGELREVERSIYGRQRVLAFMAIASIVIGVLINEICADGDYVEVRDPVNAAYLDDPSRPPRECQDGRALLLKAAQSVLTLGLLVMIVLRFRLRVHQKRVVQRLKDRRVALLRNKNSKASDPKIPRSMMVKLAFEGVLCAVHTLPFLHIDIKNEALGRTLYYRSESLLCGFMFLRLYHVYLWQEQSVFLQYFNLEDSYLIKDHKTIKLTQECATSHRTLAFKVAMTRNPRKMIGTFVLLLLSSCTYIVRIAEGPAAMPHSKYIWNQMWVAITQATTGYGESVPVTHIGRFACIVVMLFMPIIIALMTASTTKALNLSPDEALLMQGIDKNRKRVRVLTAAASLVQHWWRGVSSTHGSSVDRHKNMQLVREMYIAAHELKSFYVTSKVSRAEDSKGLLEFVGMPHEAGQGAGGGGGHAGTAKGFPRERGMGPPQG